MLTCVQAQEHHSLDSRWPDGARGLGLTAHVLLCTFVRIPAARGSDIEV
jgi:hypothetical protein